MKDAHKLFENCFKDLGNFEEGAEGAAAGENPFLQACSQMFKDFENVSKEGNNN